METRDLTARGIRFSISKEGTEVAYAFLYLLTNDAHKQPFGFLEYVHVDENHRGAGLGNELLKAVIGRAKKEKCYKLIATSRNNGTREMVHEWYKRRGFTDYGKEFRINF